MRTGNTLEYQGELSEKIDSNYFTLCSDLGIRKNAVLLEVAVSLEANELQGFKEAFDLIKRTNAAKTLLHGLDMPENERGKEPYFVDACLRAALAMVKDKRQPSEKIIEGDDSTTAIRGAVQNKTAKMG